MEWIDFNSKYNHSCRDCTMRHVGCHSKCEKYKEEKALRAKEVKGLAKEHERQTLGNYREGGRKRRLF
jgi:hypothetical protein